MRDMTTTLFLNERRDEEGVVAVGGYCGYEAVTCLAAQNGRDTPPGRVMPGGDLKPERLRVILLW